MVHNVLACVCGIFLTHLTHFTVTAFARKQSNSQIQGEIGDGAMEKDSGLNEGVWVNLGTQVYTNICNI